MKRIMLLLLEQKFNNIILQDGSGRVWNKTDGKFIKSLAGHRDNVCAISF